MPASPIRVSTHLGETVKRQDCNTVTTLGVPEHTKEWKEVPQPIPPAVLLD